MSKKDFKLTLKGILELLEIEEIGSKELLKNKIKNASIEDLRDLQYSVQTEINLRYAKGEL